MSINPYMTPTWRTTTISHACAVTSVRRGSSRRGARSFVTSGSSTNTGSTSTKCVCWKWPRNARYDNYQISLISWDYIILYIVIFLFYNYWEGSFLLFCWVFCWVSNSNCSMHFRKKKTKRDSGKLPRRRGEGDRSPGGVRSGHGSIRWGRRPGKGRENRSSTTTATTKHFIHFFTTTSYM